VVLLHSLAGAGRRGAVRVVEDTAPIDAARGELNALPSRPKRATDPAVTSNEPAQSAAPRVVIISPCRDEARTVERTIACMEAQTAPPLRWVIVDDGSTDATPQILAAAAARISWLRVVRRADRGFRKVGGGVIDAFYEGLASVDVPYDFVSKMDVDLEFSPRYLERILGYFARDPQLAAASGKVFRPEGDGFVEEFMIDEMVAGQFKLYRRDAFERIGGFVREVMWDGIDFHCARQAGYRTASLPDPELRIIHLRLMGSSDKSVYTGRLRWGRGQWFMGSSLSYVVASGMFRMRERPYVLGGLLIVAGYLGAALRRAPRYGDLAFRRDLQRWQRQRLFGLLAGRGAR
jgi:poly-beta-1,6-N-acetyl-D-glucosamine synthase